MLTTSLTSMRRSAGSLLSLLVAGVLFSADAAAQTPAVVASSAVAVPNSQVNGAPWQSAVSNNGSFILFDFKTGGWYQFPENGGPQITLGAAGVIGGFVDSGIAVDPRNNDIYLDNNYNPGFQRFPYDAAKNTWDLPSTVVGNNLSGNLGGPCGNYFQSAGLAMNSSGVLVVSVENCGTPLFTVPVDASGNFGPATPIVAKLAARARTVAIDNVGNIYYTADLGGFKGVAYIPAGVTGLADETTVQRIDPLLGNVQGVTLDSLGNIYIADGTAGEYMVPLVNGVPDTAAAVFLAPVPASGGPSVDSGHQTLFVPTGAYEGLKNEVKVLFNRLELGSVAVGSTSATASTITYAFSAPTTPYNFAISENGTSGVFSLGTLTGCGITLTPPDSKGNPIIDPNSHAVARTTTTYKAGTTCSLTVTFAPAAVGDVSATLSMLDPSQNIINTVVLHGVGQGSEIVSAPGTESAVGSALSTPSQVATDPSGNIYVADSGLGKVLQYPKGATAKTAPVSIGTGLSAPTGVAVDATGDVFIADSGNVIEVPFGPYSYDVSGQLVTSLYPTKQVTLKSGLGTNLRLAVDDIGDVFVADPDNQRVVRLITSSAETAEIDYTGFASLSAIGASGEGDLFVADGANLIEIPEFGVQTPILSSLSGATGIAVDASGGIYVTESGQTLRIPDEGGTYTPADAVNLAAGVANPASVALDSLGNAYVLDGTAKDIDFVSASGYLNLGTLATPTSTQNGTVTIANAGNVPLNITAFSSTADFSETATTCIGAPIPAGSQCTATLTFSAGPGDQGPLTGALAVASDAANSPIVINAAGVGAALAASTSSLTASPNLTVTSAPIVINVVSTSGAAPVPTGKVTLTAIANGKVTNTFVSTLVNGTVTINATEVEAGSYTFKASYGGDRVYGTSTASIPVTIGIGAIAMAQPATSSVPTYVLSQGQGSSAIYDGSETAYEYKYSVTLTAADGNPLIGVPVYNSTTGAQTGTNYGTVTFTGSDADGNCAPIPVNASGIAVFNTSCLGINTSNNQIPNLLTTYTITPVFTSANYVSVTGTSFTVTAVRNPVVVITSTPASLSVAAGTPATANLSMTSLLGYGVLDPNSNLDNYSLPVELECNNLPPHATCSFSYPTPDPSDPNSVDVTPTTPGQAILTITTNVPVGTTTSATFRESPVVFAAMFGLSLAGLAFGRRRGLRVSLFNVVCLLFVSGMVAGVAACGSGTTGNAAVLTTPSGTYAVTVTAKQTGSKVITGNLPGETQTVYGNGGLVSLPFTVNVTVQ